MKLFDGCLLACDVDGTLMTNGVIPQRNIEKIAWFVEQGGCFSLSTGRTRDAVGMVLAQVDGIGPSVVANGCMIYDFTRKETLYELNIPKTDYRFAKDAVDRGNHIGVEIHSGEHVFVLQKNAETEEHAEYEWLHPEYVDYDTAAAFNWNKVLYAGSTPEEIASLKCFPEEPCQSVFMNTSTTFFGRQRFYREQIPQGVSKATALAKLRDLLHIKNGCYYAIGDYYNDLEMITEADIGAAPADSPDDIRLRADFITCSVADGAVADFIDHLTKIRKGCNEWTHKAKKNWNELPAR